MRTYPSLLAAVLMAGIALVKPTISAQTYHYIGEYGEATAPEDGWLDEAENWDGGVLPGFNLDTVLSFGGSETGYAYTAQFGASETLGLNRLILANDVATYRPRISGGVLSFLEDSASEGPTVTLGGAASFGIQAEVRFSTALTIDGSGTGSIHFERALLGLSNAALNVSSAGSVWINHATSSITGTTSVTNGTLYAANNVLKGNLHVSDGGTLSTAGGATATRQAVVEGGGTWNTTGGTGETLASLRIGNGADSGGGASRVNLGNIMTLTGTGANVLHLEGSATTPAVLSLGGQGGSAAGGVLLNAGSIGAGTTTLVFGPHSRVEALTGATSSITSDVGRIRWSGTGSASNYLTYRFDGATINTIGYGTPGGPALYDNRFQIGDFSNQTTGYHTQVQINAGLGDGTGYLQVSRSTIALGWSGVEHLGALIGTVGNNGNNIVVGTQVSGMLGGQIWGAGDLASGPGGYSASTSLTFQTRSGGDPATFTLGVSGTALANQAGVIDVRSGTDAQGRITQNNVNLHIQGGALRGNYLNDGTGTITLSNQGELLLRGQSGAQTFNVSTTGVGANNRTIFLSGANAGALLIHSNNVASRINLLETLAGNATWDRGRITGGANMLIADTAGISASNTTTTPFYNGFTIGANSGLEGVSIGYRTPFANSGAGSTVAAAMTLGTNASYYGMTSTTGLNSFNYYIGTSDQLASASSEGLGTTYNAGIAVAGAGDFLFGLHQTGNHQNLTSGSGLNYLGDNLVEATLSSDPVANGLRVGGTVRFTNFNGAASNTINNNNFLITAIDGNKITFKLPFVPEGGLESSNTPRYETHQTLHLLRDRGDDSVALISSGNNGAGAISIAANQTGSGTLWAQAWEVVLEQGVSFSGNLFSGNGTETPWNRNGTLRASGVSDQSFIVHGVLGVDGSDTVNVALNRQSSQHSSIVLGQTAQLNGTHHWSVSANRSSSSLFDNNLVDPNRWNASVDLRVDGVRGLLEASTNASTPSTGAHYRFNSVTIEQGSFGTSAAGVVRLVNTVQNNGGSGKEAFYAGALNISANGGGSRYGLLQLNLNGQDLWYETLNTSYDSGRGLNSQAFAFANDAKDSVSTLRNLGVGVPIYGAAFFVSNGATLEVEGARWYGTQWYSGGVTGGILRLPSDDAANPNNGGMGNVSTQVISTTLWNGEAGGVTNGVSFLGSGSAGSDLSTTQGTGGTLHIVDNAFTTTGYVLNPVNVEGAIDTRNRAGDAYHDVTFRSSNYQRIRGAQNDTRIFTQGRNVYGVGEIVHLSGGDFDTYKRYYVVAVGEDAGEAYVQVSESFGGTPVALSANLNFGASHLIRDFGESKATDASQPQAALVVAGTTNIEGNLRFVSVLETGSATALDANQATLRVGGVTASATPVALSDLGTLNVRGDLFTELGINVAIQSNARVNVGGNVSIAGVGTNRPFNVTGTGVGIHADSHLTLTGASGQSTPQQVAITPSVGHFNVGVAGGASAHGQLAADLTALSSLSINGAGSRLDLAGHTLRVGSTGAGEVVSSGQLTGAGRIEADVTLLAGGHHTIGGGALQTITGDLRYEAGSAFTWSLGENSATDGYDTLSIGGVLAFDGPIAFNLSLNAFGSTVDFTDAFWSQEQNWDIVSFASTSGGGYTLGAISLDSLGQSYGSFGRFHLQALGDGVQLQWQVAPIPEPSTYLLLLSSGAGIWWLRRRRTL